MKYLNKMKDKYGGKNNKTRNLGDYQCLGFVPGFTHSTKFRFSIINDNFPERGKEENKQDLGRQFLYLEAFVLYR